MIDLTKYVDKINSGLLTDVVIEKVLQEVYMLGYDNSKKDTLQDATSQLKSLFKRGKKDA